MLVNEILARKLRDRRVVTRYAGLTGAPDESGRRTGPARAGNARVRSIEPRDAADRIVSAPAIRGAVGAALLASSAITARQPVSFQSRSNTGAGPIRRTAILSAASSAAALSTMALAATARPNATAVPAGRSPADPRNVPASQSSVDAPGRPRCGSRRLQIGASGRGLADADRLRGTPDPRPDGAAIAWSP
jgi:hypothetical protein